MNRNKFLSAPKRAGVDYEVVVSGRGFTSGKRASVIDYDVIAVNTGTRNFTGRRDDKGEPIMKRHGSDPAGNDVWTKVSFGGRHKFTGEKLSGAILKTVAPGVQDSFVVERIELDAMLDDATRDERQRAQAPKARVCMCKGGRINHKCPIHADQYTTATLYVCPLDGVHFRKRTGMQDCCTQCWEAGKTPMARAFRGKG